MEDSEIKRLLQTHSGPARHRGWSCPDDIQLSAFVVQSLSSAEKSTIEAHIADCDFCLSQVVFLTQSADWPNSEEAPANLVSGARRLVKQKQGKLFSWGWRWAAASTAVACLVLLVLVIFLQRRTLESPRPSETLLAQSSPVPGESPRIIVAPTPSHPEPSQSTAPPKVKSNRAPEVRNTTAEDLLPKLIAPRNGVVIRRQDLEFRWTPLTEAIFYEVRVMSTDGDVVFEKQTEETALKPDSTAPLVGGTKYFATVRAHLRQGKAVKSDVISFSLAH